MDDSKDGVIYFTFGSMVLIETLPTKILNDIYASFKKVSPVRVLMKIVDSSKLPPGLPDNVKVLPWIPQQTILGKVAKLSFSSSNLSLFYCILQTQVLNFFIN